MSTQSNKRYQLLREIGTGDFATVFVAMDTKLGREVAVKKIHDQFLNDDEKLTRYWQEANLLISLEHPNIMTIFDVVKSKGCLVLELMQGSLKQIYAGRAAPLDDVRQIILQAANGLHHLHENGIIHGDIKPGNLLLSRQNLVKLGDFGLARRASDSDGSLLKGATKYMAPELVSDQFGPVGPASDLYSLGFTALELMCGPDYDSLFPELHAFGRDQQMAWMMWHCSADRKLPDIHAMLADVPDDLAAVLGKLTAKDQRKRYRSAAEVLKDLSSGGQSVPIGTAMKEEAAAAELARKQQKKRRLGAMAMFATSLALCMAILFWPKKVEEPPPAPAKPQPVYGVVQSVFAENEKLVIDLTDKDGKVDPNSEKASGWKEITLFSEDRIFLNRKERQLRDLNVGDRIVIRDMLDVEQKPYHEIAAFRPNQHRGRIKRVELDEGKFVLAIDEGEDAGSELIMAAPATIPVTLNGESEASGKPLTLDDLQADDRVDVKHVETETGTEALSVNALRVIESKGIVRDIDLKKRMLVIARDDADATLVRMPYAPNCAVTLNGLRFLNNQLLKPSDIKPGDKVTVKYDVEIVSVDAGRLFGESGTVSSIDYETGTLRIKQAENTIVYVVDPKATLTLGGESIALDDLRKGDTVSLTHDAPGDKTPAVLTLDAQRPANPRKWAILVANQNYDDRTLSPLDYPLQDAQQLRDRLIKRYAVPPEQAILLEDESRVRLEQAIPAALEKIPADAELYFYLATHAYQLADPSTSGNNIYLAPADFALARIETTGIKLDWLVSLLDRCPATRKMLLLDSCHAGAGADLDQQPSSAEMINVIRKLHEGGYPQTLYVLASCDAKQRGLLTSDGHSLFAVSLSKAFAGEADKGRDNQLDFTELFKFVEKRVTDIASETAAVQTPKLFLPDDTPPRLTEEAKAAILQLLTQFGQRKIDKLSLLASIETANNLANGQPEPMLAGAYLLLKAGERDETVQMFEQVRLAYPDSWLAHQGLAWFHFNLRDYQAGLESLQRFVKAIPEPAKEFDDATLARFEWIGRLRELADRSTWGNRKPPEALGKAIDELVAARGAAALQKYNAGRQHVLQIFADYEREISENPQDQVSIDLKRRRVAIYADFNPESVIPILKSGLDK